MFYLLQTSPGVTLQFWQIALLALITASGYVAAAFIARKRRSSSNAEDDKVSAESHSIAIHDVNELMKLVTRMRRDAERSADDASKRADEAAKRAEEHRRQQEFSREQIRLSEEDKRRTEANGTIARKAMHAALKELGRCVVAIHLRDEAIQEWGVANKCAEDLLTANKVEFKKAKVAQVPPFEQLEYEDIVNFQALVLPPESTR